jgi:hypothetical protein
MKTKHSEDKGWFDRQVARFEEARFAFMTLLLTAQSCLGSVAAMYSLEKHNYLMLSVGAAVTMGSNAVFIAQAPARWCLGIFYISVATNLLLIILTCI